MLNMLAFCLRQPISFDSPVKEKDCFLTAVTVALKAVSLLRLRIGIKRVAVFLVKFSEFVF